MIHIGDCLDVLPTLDAESVDAIVTDPPYHLTSLSRNGAARTNNPATPHGRTRLGEAGFMGKTWDGGDIAFRVEVWREALRVLKPGGHLVAFGGTRTYHRMACAIEDAGFEIRDCMQWIYGSGFPKSLDVSKAIDKHERGRMVRQKLYHFMTHRGHTPHSLANAMGLASAASVGDWTHGGHTPSDENYALAMAALGVSEEEHAAFEREVVGMGVSGVTAGMQQLGPSGITGGDYNITAPATDAAKQWDGYGTALKPANEPIVLARKPLIGTVAANVLEHGTGALNVDGCRVGHSDQWSDDGALYGGASVSDYGDGLNNAGRSGSHAAGRWPPNVLLTHSPHCNEVSIDGEPACVEGCPVAMLDAQSGERPPMTGGGVHHDGNGAGMFGAIDSTAMHSDHGGASRYFPRFRYCAKASTGEREAGLSGATKRFAATMGDGIGAREHNPKHASAWRGNTHPTVKPLDLMRWLVRLVAPPGGTVLDLFTGSGSTGMACVIEGVEFIGIEETPEYAAIAEKRIAACRRGKAEPLGSPKQSADERQMGLWGTT